LSGIRAVVFALVLNLPHILMKYNEVLNPCHVGTFLFRIASWRGRYDWSRDESNPKRDLSPGAVASCG
jgi:hypothetical protein